MKVLNKKWYVGYTPANVIERLKKHNAGMIQSTKAFLPWKLIYSGVCVERNDAAG